MTRNPQPISDRLTARIAAQGGVFCRSDAVDLGHHDHDLRTWVRTGEVVQATRGGYYVAPENQRGWPRLTIPEQNAEHERRRVLAVLQVLPPSFVASHVSALHLHGLPRLCVPARDAAVHVMATASARLPRRPHVRPHAPVPGTTTAGWRRWVSVEDAIAQAGCLHGLVGALIPADAAMASGRLDLELLASACARVSGLPGSTGVGTLLPLVNGKSESPGETWLRLVCVDAGIPVTPQVWMSDDRGRFARVDLLVDGTRVILEFDGIAKYDDPEEARREKIREHRLHRLGYVVVRVIWEDFVDIPALVRRICAAIARAGAAH